MGVGAGLYMYDVVVKSSRSLSHLLMSSCTLWTLGYLMDKRQVMGKAKVLSKKTVMGKVNVNRKVAKTAYLE